MKVIVRGNVLTDQGMSFEPVFAIRQGETKEDTGYLVLNPEGSALVWQKEEKDYTLLLSLPMKKEPFMLTEKDGIEAADAITDLIDDVNALKTPEKLPEQVITKCNATRSGLGDRTIHLVRTKETFPSFLQATDSMHDAKLSFVETKDNVLQVRFLQVGEKEQVLDLWFLGTPAFHLTEDMPIGSELPACTLKGSGAGRYLVGGEPVSSVNEEYLNAHNLLWFRGKTILWYLHEDPGDEVSYDVPTQIFYEYAQNTEALKDNPMMEKAFLRAVDVLTERDNIDALRFLAYATYGEGQYPYHTDYKTSEKCLLRLMDLSPDVWYADSLGYIYYYGRTTDKVPDDDRAVYYFSIGAAGGLIEARYKLADLYAAGRGVPKSTATARNLVDHCYEEVMPQVLCGETGTWLADVARRLGALEEEAGHPKKACYYYLQAQYGIQLRQRDYSNFGDDKVAAAIREGLQRAWKKAGFGEKRTEVERGSLADFLGDTLNFVDAPLILTIKQTGLRRCDIRAKIYGEPENDEKGQRLFLTLPEAAWCGLLPEVRMEGNLLQHMERIPFDQPVLVDDIKESFLAFGENLVGQLDGVFTVSLTGPANTLPQKRHR